MARRTIEQRIAGLRMGGTGLMLIIVAAVIIIVRTYPVQMAALAVAAIAFLSWAKRRSARRLQLERERAERCADGQLERHRKTLVSYFRQSIRPIPFGGEDTSQWQRRADDLNARAALPSKLAGHRG